MDPLDHPDCETVFVFNGTEGDDVIDGTPYNDLVFVFEGGRDTVRTFGGDDDVVVHAEQDADDDSIDLGAGDDIVRTRESPSIATIVCGPGDDTARVDPDDIVADDCETVCYVGG